MTDTPLRIRCVTYSRISLDAQGTGLGVSRQSEANRKLARDRDWEIVAEYVDNDISATDKRKVRPAYNEMLAAYNRGEFDALVCWDLDRLTRQPRQLEDWIDAAEMRGLRLVTANGEADLTTDGGRLFARIKSAVARGEVERKSARQKAAHAQRAASGHPWKGSRRAFGFEPKNLAHDEEEADALAQAYTDVLAGHSLTSVAANLNKAGLTTTMGNAWKANTVRQLLLNPRNAGILAHRDKIVGAGEWKPIVSEDKWRAVHGILTGNPHTRQRTSPHLLSGLIDCGLCGTPLTAGYRPNHTRIYRCPACTKISRNADHLDLFITETVVHRLNLPDAADLLVDNDAPDLAMLQDEVKVQRVRIQQFAEALGDGEMTYADWAWAAGRAKAKLAAAEAAMVHTDNAAVLGDLVDPDNDAGEVWNLLPLDRRRAVIRLLLKITVLPTTRGTQFIPDHIRVEEREL